MTYFVKNDQGEFVEVQDKLYTEAEYKSVKDKNTELRTTNTTLLKSNETLSAFASVLDGVQNLSPEGLMKKIEEQATRKAEAMVTEMKTKHQTEFGELNKKYESASAKLHQLVLGDAVRKAGPKHGVLETAYDDVLRRAEADFKVEDGKVVFAKDTLDANGQPYTVETWLAETVKKAPHLASQPKGPGARQPASFRSSSVNRDDAKTSPLDKITSGLTSRQSGGKRLT